MFKKLAFGGVGLLFLVSPLVSSAQTTSAVQAQIDALLKQITQLQAQVATLRVQSTTPTTGTSSCLDLNNALVIGSTDATTNGEVSKLQSFLIAAGMYPEARMTGYYGTLTAQAVMRWQKAHGMDFVTLTSGVGPMTRGKMACANASATSSASPITFTFPSEQSVLQHWGEYTVKWTGQSNSDHTLVTLKATDPACSNVGLVVEGERGCSAIELGRAKLSDGSFLLRLQPGVSPLLPATDWNNSKLAVRDSKARYALIFDTPSGRVTSPTFTVQSNDFVITPSITKSSFTPGETINFSVRGVTDTGEATSPALGFSAKVFLEWGDNWGSGGSAIYREGTYNQTTKQWDFVTTAPTTLKNDYRIFLYVKCSNQNLCAQKYTFPLEKEALLKFNVSN